MSSSWRTTRTSGSTRYLLSSQCQCGGSRYELLAPYFSGFEIGFYKKLSSENHTYLQLLYKNLYFNFFRCIFMFLLTGSRNRPQHISYTYLGIAWWMDQSMNNIQNTRNVQNAEHQLNGSDLEISTDLELRTIPVPEILPMVLEDRWGSSSVR